MKLQGRNMAKDMTGSDVALLHRELRQLNFTIPDDEAERVLFGPGTEQAVREFQRQKGLEPSGVVDERTAEAMTGEVAARQPRVVRGMVTHDGGVPAVGLTVRAFDRDLRREEPLAQAKTGGDGRYEIEYMARQFRRVEKESADLVVRVIGRDNRVLLSSDVIFNAGPVETVDFILDGVDARVSEYERYLAELRPLLEGFAPSALDERDIAFLEGETGIEGLHLAYLAIAHRHAAVTRIGAEAFYGLFRQDLPTSLPALLLQRPARLRRSLELSIEQNIIPSRLLDELSRILDALRQHAGKSVLRDAQGDAAVVPRLLKSAGLSEDEQEAFLNFYLRHDGSIEEFWRSLAATPLAAKVQPLQATLQLGLLTRNNVPLVSALRSIGVRSVRDLPRIGREGLRRLILGSDDILAAIEAEAGETNEQKATRFAEGMLETLRAAAPTAFVRAIYEQAGEGVRRDVARVLSNAPELELRDDDVERFLSENPRSLEGIADPKPVLRQLKRIQRVLRIAPDAEHAEALLAEGLDSAQAIASMSPDAFVEQFAGRFGGEAQARSYHTRADRTTDAVVGIVAAITQSVQDVRPAVVGPVPDSIQKLPNFTTLFGSQSFCSCEHCGSVLSPAAYLVDLLQFINPRSGRKPITELRRRRPDIEHIPLTCENTNTPLPYVDLVNEVLEFYVAHGKITTGAARDTREMTVEELSVNPQYLIRDAYETLAEAVYPPTLPFHYPLEVARLYLSQLGSSQHELMEVFRRDGQSSEADIEYLKLSAFEHTILTGETGRLLGAFYGFPRFQNVADPDEINVDEIKVSAFLRRAGLTYEELLEVLATRFINPDRTIKEEDDVNPTRCDLEKRMLTDLTPAFWRRAHRFIRLWRKLGWSAHDLDRAFVVLQEREITLAFLRKLAAVEKLRHELALPLPVLLSFWGKLDTEGPDSLYAQLFQNKAVLNPPDPAFRVFRLTSSTEFLADHAAAVLAALRLSADDLDALTRHLGLQPATATLSLSFLSALHRHVSLARALRLSVKDFLSLLTLTRENPFGTANPGATLRFVERARLMKESGFTVAQLSYLYLSETPNPFAPPDETLNSLFDSLRNGLRRITDEAPQLLALTSEALRSALPLVMREELVGDAESIIEKTAPLDADDLAFITTHFTFLEAAEANALSLDPTPDARRARVLASILAWLRRDFVLQALGESLHVDGPMVTALVERILVAQSNPAKMALQDFLNVADLPEGAFDNTAFRRSYLRLHKAAVLAVEFRISASELVYLHEHAEDFDDLDLNRLPLEPADFNVQQFRQWRRLARYAAFSRGLPQRDATLTDVFEAARLPAQRNPRETAIERLKLATGWNPEEVDFLAGPEGFDLTAQDFRNEERLVSLQRCIHLGSRLGVSCAQLFRWSSAEPDASVAEEIVSAAKAKSTDDQWHAFARPLNDALRERRKDALIAYTLNRTGFADSNRLFEHFLIDVEMSACMKTSRIKQAISSVQLFIQRCLMGLEDMNPSAINAEQWEWMKNYRVWEASRKVFLYPENWIEPELRDDKSPFFRDLEGELLQGDLDAVAAEQSFLHYLEKLNRVARLEPCGLYVQQEPDGEEVVHVFGRTATNPHSYFYRRLVNGRTWTPWEQVDLDIEGDHLMPIVHDRRLYLFWLRFEQRQNKSQQFPHGFISSEEHYTWLQMHRQWLMDHAGQPDAQEPPEPGFSNPPPITHWEIKLSWSEYQRGGWTAKRTSTESIISPMVTRDFGQYAESVEKMEDIQFKEDLATSWGTVAAAYLPEEHTHFATPEITSTGLVFYVWRRYNKSVKVLLDDSMGLTAYEALGGFILHCGSNVQVYSMRRETEFQISSPLDFFYGLDRPAHTTNYAHGFRNLFDPHVLSFYINGQQRDILTNKIAGGFSLLSEYGQFGYWRLGFGSPYQDFFYQDQEKTYYARYQIPPKYIRDIIWNPSRALLITSPRMHEPVATAFDKRSLPLPPQTNGRHTGAKTVVRSRVPETAAPTQTTTAVTRAKDSTFTRTLRRAGIAYGAKGGNLDFLQLGPEDVTGQVLDEEGFRFHTFFHPHVCAFTERLHRGGLPALLSRSTQQLTNEQPPTNIFEQRYAPTSEVARPYPREDVSFFGGGAYAPYNWELFFHIPMLVAVSLTRNQRFAEALRWFHFVFNPTTSSTASSPARYWMTLPFFHNSDPAKDQVRELLLTLAERRPGWENIQNQIAEWLDNPFNPHLIARLRHTAYQKNVVMKYIDNLIAWGDQLFSRDTLESINEATLLYVLAYNILGPRPQTVPKEQPDARTYSELRGELDAFGNALVEVENAVPNLTLFNKLSWGAHTKALSGEIKLLGKAVIGGAASGGPSNPPSNLMTVEATTQSARPEFTFNAEQTLKSSRSVVRSLYFCVPQNEQLLRYWNTVEDRLFKIRHCMNIEGAVRELPLFEPPIDPALLVRAAAAGLDIGSVLNDLFAPLPRYRFSLMLQKAQELVAELKSLGGALLSALEKRDAEALSNLRATHETSLLRAVMEVRRQQMAEARSSLEALNKTLEATQHRRTHYESLLSQGLIAEESARIEELKAALKQQRQAQSLYLDAHYYSLIPDFEVGTSGVFASPVATGTIGGSLLVHGVTAFAMNMENNAANSRARAEMSSITGVHLRRAEEWAFQVSAAQKEIAQIDKQIVAAEIRRDIAEKELRNHELQIENSEAVEEFLRGKYTREELYGWMTTQVSTVYFQAYKLASDIAKRAERAFRFELGLEDSNFVQFGYWDSLRKGLLAGEQLSLDLKRMESAYLEQNRREYEITKHVSLLLHDPLALIKLKQLGECIFFLPEKLFDMDYPGHYMRRLKSVSLSIPCVTGPYTSVNCTLTLSKNETRIKSTPSEPYDKSAQGEDNRFVANFAAQQSIATSHAQNDAGVFNLDFRDERYLPFEGAGADSEWKIELPAKNNAFDFDTISDVVLHLKYTARDGGEALRTAAQRAVNRWIAGAAAVPLARLFSLRNEFPTEWHRFLRQPEPREGGERIHRIRFDLRERFPFLFRGRGISIRALRLFLKLKDGYVYDNAAALGFDLLGNSAPPQAEPSFTSLLQQPPVQFQSKDKEFAGVPFADPVLIPSTAPLDMALEIPVAATEPDRDTVRLFPDAVNDIWLICNYAVEPNP